MSSPLVKQEEWGQNEAGEKLGKEDILRAMIASTGEGPGRFLRQFRELTGMSAMEAASRMNISLHQLNSLEEDDFTNLPAPIYVRSYLRRFAELFDVPEKDLFAAYTRCGESVTPNIQRVSQRERIHAKGIPTKWITYGVGAILAVALLLMAKTAGVDEWFASMGSKQSEEVSTQLELPMASPTQPDELPPPAE
jgi:cytoskeletal protein RodZ